MLFGGKNIMTPQNFDFNNTHNPYSNYFHFFQCVVQKHFNIKPELFNRHAIFVRMFIIEA